jgi:phospholipase/carboxylesterase
VTRALQFKRKAAKSGRAKSLMVFLHGYGADGADLLGLADPLAPYLPDTVFVAPDAADPCKNNPFGFQWFGIPWMDGTPEEEMVAGIVRAVEDINAFLDERLAAEGLGPEALAVFGFSQGAMMALHIAPRVLLMHGDRDPVVPFESMEEAEQELGLAGFDVFSHVMKGTPHGIAPDGLSVTMQFLRERLPK